MVAHIHDELQIESKSSLADAVGKLAVESVNEAGEHYLLEINTLPGMTSTSLLPKAAMAAGLEFPDLIDTIIKIASMEE